MTIALVDWYWQGHHPTYFAHYILALEEMGIDVLAICPNPDGASAIANALRQRSTGGCSKRGENWYRKVKIPEKRFSSIRPARIAAIDWTVRHFRNIEKDVRAWVRESGTKVDAIFYACMYDWDFEWIRFTRPFLRMPWLGLYLHALSYRMPGTPHSYNGRPPQPEKMFSGELCRGIGILDEGISGKVAAAIGRPAVVLPDLTDERRATTAEERMLGERLKQFAAGRPIVGLFGYLQKSKGLLTFLETARMPAASDICFALGGEIAPSRDNCEVVQIHRILAECSNVWNHLARIDEPHFNHLLDACDILFAAYLDFPHSSNIQTKAALWKKPLIVSDGYLMAERVKRYNLGEVIPQGNANASLEAVLKIASDPTGWATAKQPRQAEYVREHSFEKLKIGFQKLLTTV